ncbi:dumpy [Daphnia sinensis]|uniref:Dumpy n=1 Tax=Daphnia sinensis TaxID=1820382 RepID=A0AAD5LKZ5_9CRUS|nr:dumpy [Daphnia sinensis]
MLCPTSSSPDAISTGKFQKTPRQSFGQEGNERGSTWRVIVTWLLFFMRIAADKKLMGRQLMCWYPPYSLKGEIHVWFFIFIKIISRAKMNLLLLMSLFAITLASAEEATPVVSKFQSVDPSPELQSGQENSTKTPVPTPGLAISAEGTATESKTAAAVEIPEDETPISVQEAINPEAEWSVTDAGSLVLAEEASVEPETDMEVSEDPHASVESAIELMSLKEIDDEEAPHPAAEPIDLHAEEHLEEESKPSIGQPIYTPEQPTYPIVQPTILDVGTTIPTAHTTVTAAEKITAAAEREKPAMESTTPAAIAIVAAVETTHTVAETAIPVKETTSQVEVVTSSFVELATLKTEKIPAVETAMVEPTNPVTQESKVAEPTALVAEATTIDAKPITAIVSFIEPTTRAPEAIPVVETVMVAGEHIAPTSPDAKPVTLATIPANPSTEQEVLATKLTPGAAGETMTPAAISVVTKEIIPAMEVTTPVALTTNSAAVEHISAVETTVAEVPRTPEQPAIPSVWPTTSHPAETVWGGGSATPSTESTTPAKVPAISIADSPTPTVGPTIPAAEPALPIAEPVTPSVEPATPAAVPAAPAILAPESGQSANPAVLVSEVATVIAEHAASNAEKTTLVAELATPTVMLAIPTEKPAIPAAELATPVVEPATPPALPTIPTTEPTTATTMPTLPPAESTTSITDPTTSATDKPTPAAELAIPPSEPTTLSAKPASPVAELPTPVVEPAIPTALPTIPTTEPTTPAAESATTSAHSTTLAAGPPTPVAEPATAAADPTTLALGAATPKVELPTSIADSATSAAHPGTPAAHPATPAAESPTPVVEHSTPTTLPTTHATEPTIPAAMPATPAPEPAHPAVELATPAANPTTSSDPATPAAEPITPGAPTTIAESHTSVVPHSLATETAIPIVESISTAVKPISSNEEPTVPGLDRTPETTAASPATQPHIQSAETTTIAVEKVPSSIQPEPLVTERIPHTESTTSVHLTNPATAMMLLVTDLTTGTHDTPPSVGTTIPVEAKTNPIAETTTPSATEPTTTTVKEIMLATESTTPTKNHPVVSSTISGDRRTTKVPRKRPTTVPPLRPGFETAKVFDAVLSKITNSTSNLRNATVAQVKKLKEIWLVFKLHLDALKNKTIDNSTINATFPLSTPEEAKVWINLFENFVNKMRHSSATQVTKIMGAWTTLNKFLLSYKEKQTKKPAVIQVKPTSPSKKSTPKTSVTVPVTHITATTLDNHAGIDIIAADSKPVNNAFSRTVAVDEQPHKLADQIEKLRNQFKHATKKQLEKYRESWMVFKFYLDSFSPGWKPNKMPVGNADFTLSTPEEANRNRQMFLDFVTNWRQSADYRSDTVLEFWQELKDLLDSYEGIDAETIEKSNERNPRSFQARPQSKDPSPSFGSQEIKQINIAQPPKSIETKKTMLAKLAKIAYELQRSSSLKLRQFKENWILLKLYLDSLKSNSTDAMTNYHFLFSNAEEQKYTHELFSGFVKNLRRNPGFPLEQLMQAWQVLNEFLNSYNGVDADYVITSADPDRNHKLVPTPTKAISPAEELAFRKALIKEIGKLSQLS